ncbi:MAG: PEP-CTERM sorting domain-containing protein [Dehalococcoidia bacterium]|nr:PEP-CTERM sorting domain-containing protein [Dehalococcoidia bacterium]
MAGYGYNPEGQLESWIARIPEPNGLLLLVFGLTLMAGRRQGN